MRRLTSLQPFHRFTLHDTPSAVISCIVCGFSSLVRRSSSARHIASCLNGSPRLSILFCPSSSVFPRWGFFSRSLPASHSAGLAFVLIFGHVVVWSALLALWELGLCFSLGGFLSFSGPVGIGRPFSDDCFPNVTDITALSGGTVSGNCFLLVTLYTRARFS